MEYILREWRTRKAKKFIKDGTLVADLGCGYKGSFLKSISRQIRKGVGYDVSVVKKGLPKNIVLKTIDLNKKIDNKRDYYDFVTALAVLEHVENPETFLKKIKMMLKTGGKIIITTPHKKAKSILEFLSFKMGFISKDEIADHKNYFDEKTLKILLDSVGLKTIKLTTFEFGNNLFCVAQKII